MVFSTYSFQETENMNKLSLAVSLSRTGLEFLKFCFTLSLCLQLAMLIQVLLLYYIINIRMLIVELQNNNSLLWYKCLRHVSLTNK